MNQVKTTLTDFQLDALREIGNIGIGNATTSLSKMMNRTVKNSLTNLELIPLLKLPDRIGGEDAVVGVIQELRGDIKGYILLMMSQESAKLLIELVFGSAEETNTFNEMEESVLKELGSIMSGSYITALSNFLGISIGVAPPAHSHDISSAIINQIVGMMSQDVNYVIFLNTEFATGTQKIDGKIIIFINTSSLSKLLEAIHRIVG